VKSITNDARSVLLNLSLEQRQLSAKRDRLPQSFKHPSEKTTGSILYFNKSQLIPYSHPERLQTIYSSAEESPIRKIKYF